MSEKTPTLILRLTMSDIPAYDAAHKCGKFKAEVRGVRCDAQYDDPPDTWLWSHDSLYADMVMMTYYGDPEVNNGYAYGPVEVGYEGVALVRAQEAERFYKGLTKVSRAYDKLCQQYGRPKSTGHEVAYYMAVMGIKSACVPLPPGGGGLRYRDYCILTSPEAVQSYIDVQMAAFRSARLAQQPVAA
jgi:hypothetical protein